MTVATRVGMDAAFAAREVFVSTESIIDANGPTNDSAYTDTTKPLAAAMQADRYTSGPYAGKPVWKIAGGRQHVDLVRAGDAVHEHSSDRQKRNRRLGLADLHDRLHERAGVCGLSGGFPDRDARFSCLTPRMNGIIQP